MSLKEILEIVVQFLVLPILLYFVKMAGSYLVQKIRESKAKTEDENKKNLLTFIDNLIHTCVAATNQTFVDALKKENLFDAEAQKEALNKALQMILENLTEDAKDYIESITGNLDAYLIPRIEGEVKEQKIFASL